MAYKTENITVSSMAVDIVNQMGIVLRTVQLHSINNIAVTSVIEKYVFLVNSLLAEESTLLLELRGEYFYINEHRIRFLPEHFLNFDYLIREFKTIELGTVHIKKTVTLEDIKSFVLSLNSSMFQKDPFDAIQEKMSRLPHIELKKLEKYLEEDDLDVKKMVRKTYLNAVSYTIGVFNKIKKGEKVGFRKAKRVITSMVNNILEHEQILLSMTAIKNYDAYTYHHSTNVSILSVALGQRLGLSRHMLIELGIIALFHDIGKIEVPPEVLNKPGSLDDDEWKIIRRHPKWGVKTLLNLRTLDTTTVKASIVAFEHHLNPDFSGYPALRSPMPLDLFSRIVSITDKYDAMTSSRVYSKVPMSADKALSILMENTGKEVDPLIFKFFINMVGIYPIGTLVLLDTKELGLVQENNYRYLLRPRILVIADRNGNWIKSYIADLTEKNEQGKFLRSIIKTMNPAQYNINLAKYFL